MFIQPHCAAEPTEGSFFPRKASYYTISSPSVCCVDRSRKTTSIAWRINLPIKNPRPRQLKVAKLRKRRNQSQAVSPLSQSRKLCPRTPGRQAKRNARTTPKPARSQVQTSPRSSVTCARILRLPTFKTPSPPEKQPRACVEQPEHQAAEQATPLHQVAEQATPLPQETSLKSPLPSPAEQPAGSP